ncbi:hypothetical protein CVT26_015778 [Gymnopilus dilepis]|uniref:Uncharacterized protein n=1 Tax=Gymnopilus dilepis TaxID=231916 RepID=A0A409YDB1_9AGAR|nr:hypothetical protein CVT26_015778 [Gymnopilus dilepis]
MPRDPRGWDACYDVPRSSNALALHLYAPGPHIPYSNDFSLPSCSQPTRDTVAPSRHLQDKNSQVASQPTQPSTQKTREFQSYSNTRDAQEEEYLTAAASSRSNFRYSSSAGRDAASMMNSGTECKPSPGQ